MQPHNYHPLYPHCYFIFQSTVLRHEPTLPPALCPLYFSCYSAATLIHHAAFALRFSCLMIVLPLVLTLVVGDIGCCYCSQLAVTAAATPIVNGFLLLLAGFVSTLCGVPMLLLLSSTPVAVFLLLLFLYYDKHLLQVLLVKRHSVAKIVAPLVHGLAYRFL